ncbi:hypothetical protein C4K19_0605 [Pseudomonas chlororaphis subsp. aurantiaca]|nr:hypothetical protein C4K19_0605 [Pseudomonas chlororaphis subsp. aurantiaca]AZD58550.1 hypothetical protein C4K18_0548 [Pseudomonas chlororaphis subsp. aurantiaca]
MFKTRGAVYRLEPYRLCWRSNGQGRALCSRCRRLRSSAKRSRS